ncbi:peptidylprolyl isomerase [Pelagibacterium limicola]|uniref:peptidylprolyl isomerase n=1 Tax=Pelagibacterium limicola TaxID=2791022 RepID=UPI0018AFCDED|nr:peptidylprolyl isomerase [Pelagibacterium limicola]
MLDNLRNFGRSWVAKIFLAIVILAVAGFGLPSIFLDLNTNTVARVGDQNVTAREFDRLYRGQLNQFAAQTGISPSAQQALSFGLPNATLARLANDAAIEILARRLDLGASEDRLAQLVRQDPSFAGALGAFDRNAFISVLRQAGYTESEYLNLQRKVAKREQIGLMLDGVTLPQFAAEIANSYENDRRTIEFIELNPVFFTVFEEPSEEELSQFFAENQERFRTEETRLVRLLPLTPEALAQGVAISEAQIEAEYERTAANYVTVEQRRISQLLLNDENTREVFEAGLAEGRDFVDLITEAGVETNVSPLGLFAQAQLTDAALAQAAFALPEGGFTIIPGALGPRAIWVSEIVPGGQQPVEAVRDTIEQSLRLAAGRDQLLQAYDDIEEARAAFQPIDPIAEAYGLGIYEIELTRSGAALDEVGTIPPSARDSVVNQVFAASPEASFTPAINLGSNRAVFFELIEVQPVRDQSLDEVRDEVIAAWQELQTTNALLTAADEMVAQLDMGGDMFSLAAETGSIPQASQAFGRNGTSDGTVGPDLARAAFAGGQDAAGHVQTAEGDVIVFQVTSVMPASPGETSQVADSISRGFADQVFAGFVEGLRQDTPIRVNEQTFSRLIGLE